MQKTIYTCDHCQKPLGVNFHISLCVNKGLSGIAVPPMIKQAYGAPLDHWTVECFGAGFIHLHPICAGPFFQAMTNKVLKTYFPESFAKGKKPKAKK